MGRWLEKWKEYQKNIKEKQAKKEAQKRREFIDKEEVASPKKFATFIKGDDLDRMKSEFDEQINLERKVMERLKNAPEEKRTEIAVELLKHPNYKTRVIVASLIARLGIKTIGVWFELANRLADDHKEVRLEAAKAFWNLGGVDYAIHSLRDEFNTPAHMSSVEAFKGIQVLRQASFSPTFKNLLEENWPEFLKIKKRIGELPLDLHDMAKEVLWGFFDVEMEQKISKIIAAGGDPSEYDDVARYLKQKEFLKTGKI